MIDHKTLLLGAVAYDPKVVTIWDGFQRYFAHHDLAFDYVLFSNYERQVESLFAGHIHVAWNSPLAWLECERIAHALGRQVEAIAMRDTDRGLTSVIFARSDSGIRSIQDLKGKRVAVGAGDSPQANLIPLSFVADQGLLPGKDFEVLTFEALLGKHGDHIGGERDAARAVLRGVADAACCIDANHLLFTQEAILPARATHIVAQTPAYDHCNFTVLDGVLVQQVDRFRELLLGMSYADPEVRPLLDMEGLKQWLPGRTEGYRALDQALRRFGTIDAFVFEAVVARCK
ncbi:MAG TPA: PhnD/SsuA/transferrin family substrate-binding protein [Bryobacteraceae bacterium]|jgi:ABC-type phosphate/phosphonate transport system substrate-binding protein